MAEFRKVGIVGALEREIRPLMKGCERVKRSHQGRGFVFLESDNRVAVCGGIGAEAARRASEALIALYNPGLLVSAGFAGALDGSLKVGDLFCPTVVIDAADGSRSEAGGSSGQLVSFGSVAGVQQKAKLAKAYQAQAVDMESAAVAHCAGLHGIAFAAVKAISDDCEFEMPDLQRFIANDGSFASARFAMHALVRPWLWKSTWQLAANSARASRALQTHFREWEGTQAGNSVDAGIGLTVKTKC